MKVKTRVTVQRNSKIFRSVQFMKNKYVNTNIDGLKICSQKTAERHKSWK